MTDHRMLRESLGVYALGGLEPAEATAVRAHLDGCAECRAELAEVTSVLGSLRGVDPDVLEHTPAPPPDLGDRISARVRAERAAPGRAATDRGAADRRPRTPWLAAAAVAVVALAGAGGGYAVGAGDGGSAVAAVPRETLAVQSLTPGVQAAASAIPHTWGVEITLAADGFDPGAVYRVVVRDDAGRAVDAGEFLGTGDRAMTCNLNSSVLRAQATGFDVLDRGGAVVVHGDL